MLEVTKTHIKLKKFIVSFFFLMIVFNHVSAQTIFENYRSEVYPFLNRMAQKGFIELNDIIQPITRAHINKTLIELNNKKNQLSAIEKRELVFYLQEYRNIVDTNTKIDLLKKDINNRWRSIHIQSKEFNLNADPIIGVGSFNNNGKTFKQVSNGLDLWGTIGKQKKWGYQLYYRDYTETGNVHHNIYLETPETAKILVGTNNDHQINYSEIRSNFSYSWNNGSISIGKDNLKWGYGENGNIVLSDKVPSYPYIRLDYAPLKWLSFNYLHTWLNSNLVDSNLSYKTYTGGVSGDIRVLFIQKYLASHSININPIKGLNIAIGESIVYSDQMDPGFLIPINLFKIYDNNHSNYSINAGSNGQIFFQLSSRNQIKNTHLYASTFIDEIRVSEIFNTLKSRNQLGYTIGGSITDVFVPYLTVGTEYTRVNPFVYNNLIPAQTYTSYNYSLGDWMGNNFDRKIIYIKYTPISKLKLYGRYEYIRKGGPGTLFQQYTAEPQPSFLFDYQRTKKNALFQANYEWINNVYIKAYIQWMNESYNNGLKINYTNYSVGMSFGLP